MAALIHPNIVTIHSVEEAEGRHFLTMELIEGPLLDSQLPAAGHSLAQLLEIGLVLADGLAAAHERGLVHMVEYPWTLISVAAVAARLERWDVRTSVATIHRVAPWVLDPDNAAASLRQMLWEKGLVEDRAAAYRDALRYEERGLA